MLWRKYTPLYKKAYNKTKTIPVELLQDLCHHRSSGNNEDYLMGGHSIGIIPMAISLCASFNSAYMILGEKYFIDSYGHFYMILGEMY